MKGCIQKIQCKTAMAEEFKTSKNYERNKSDETLERFLFFVFYFCWRYF